MKKIAFVFVLLALGFVCYAGGGPGKARKPAYVPKHEFSIQGSGSYNTIFLSKTGSEKIERVKYADYNNKKYGPLSASRKSRLIPAFKESGVALRAFYAVRAP